MSLLETDLGPKRQWQRVGDAYAVTKKPRGLDLDSVDSIPFAPMDAIPQGGAYDATFTPKMPASITSGTYFERGDVLVGKITPSFENGKQAFAANLPQAFGYATTEVIPLHPKNDRHDPRLLFFYLLHPDIRHYVAERMEGSTGRQRVPDNVLLDLPIPVFDKEDQTRMADALEAIHRALAAESKSETNAKELKNAAMRELFTRGLRGEAQKDTETGKSPESWKIHTLGSLGELKNGVNFSANKKGTGHLTVDVKNMFGDGVTVATQSLYRVNVDNWEDFTLKNGDILFVRSSLKQEGVGWPALFSGHDEPVLFCGFLIRLRVNDKRINPVFLTNFLRLPSVRHINIANSGKVAITNISQGMLSKLPIRIPKRDEQDEIAEILDAIDRKIDLHKRKRAVLEELFRTLLHKLMTGEIDVNDLGLSALSAANA